MGSMYDDDVSPADKLGMSEHNYRLWHVPSISQVEPNLYLGNVAASIKAEILAQHGITAMVTLLNNPEPSWAEWDAASNRLLVPRKRHLFVYTPDVQDFDILKLLPDICDWIDAQLAQDADPPEAYGGVWGKWDTVMNAPDGYVEKHLNLMAPRKKARVLVHCKAGMSRSATVVIAWVMKQHGLLADAAIDWVQGRRDVVNPNPNFRTALKIWEECECELWKDSERKVPKEPYARYLKALGEGGEEYNAWRSAWENK